MNPGQGDFFAMTLQTRIMEGQKATLDLVRIQRDAAIGIAETLLGLVSGSVGGQESVELYGQLQKLRGE
jgi:hypothetical protein